MEKHRVLVAEDDPFQRMSIVDILQMSNYEVISVENGKQALEHLGVKFPDQSNNTLTNHSGDDSFGSSQGGKELFDLVLLDLLMPEMTGKEVLDVMMQDPVLNRIPVVVMSSRNDRSIISE